MIIKSSDGIIADNTLFNLPYTALQLAPEQQWQVCSVTTQPLRSSKWSALSLVRPYDGKGSNM